MQSLIHTHLPADIVLHCVQATDKPPIVVSETDTNTLSHTHVAREVRLRFRCLHAQARLAFHYHTNHLSKGFYSTVSTVCFLFSIGMSTL